jgi:hypothetical protein
VDGTEIKDANERLEVVDKLAMCKVKSVEGRKRLLDGGRVHQWTKASGAEHIQRVLASMSDSKSASPKAADVTEWAAAAATADCSIEYHVLRLQLRLEVSTSDISTIGSCDNLTINSLTIATIDSHKTATIDSY